VGTTTMSSGTIGFCAMNIVNSRDIRSLTKAHRLFRRIHEEYGPPPNWARPEGFVSLSKIILEQQVSLASANAHFLKLSGMLKEFTPQEILNLSDAQMREGQVSRQKAIYLRELSSALLTKRLQLEHLAKCDEAVIRAQLTAIKGIGIWTSDIYLMFCLQAKDIFPIGDIAVLNTVKEVTRAQTREGILHLSLKWRPCRSLATYYLWHWYLSKRNRT